MSACALLLCDTSRVRSHTRPRPAPPTHAPPLHRSRCSADGPEVPEVPAVLKARIVRRGGREARGIWRWHLEEEDAPARPRSPRCRIEEVNDASLLIGVDYSLPLLLLVALQLLLHSDGARPTHAAPADRLSACLP